MGEFIKIPKFDLGKPGHFITDSEAIYKSDRYGRIRVPKEFETDFASIPNWIPRFLFSPMKHGRRSALFHDRLCRIAGTYEERVMADHVFLEAMKDEKVAGWRRVAMFSAVRANTYRMKIMGEFK